MLKSCWSRTATKRPTAAEIVELLYNNPRLVSPCIDVPLASVQMERTDSLELIPGTKKSPVHTTIIPTNHSSEEKYSSDMSDNRSYVNNVRESQNKNSIYSPMHASNTQHQLADFSITRPLITDTTDHGYYRPNTDNQETDLTDMTDKNGYYKTDLSDRNHNMTVGSYVQPGYIFLGSAD